jgi:hypothetical protein
LGGDFQGINTTTKLSRSMVASSKGLLPLPGKIIVDSPRPSISTSGLLVNWELFAKVDLVFSVGQLAAPSAT